MVKFNTVRKRFSEIIKIIGGHYPFVLSTFGCDSGQQLIINALIENLKQKYFSTPKSEQNLIYRNSKKILYQVKKIKMNWFSKLKFKPYKWVAFNILYEFYLPV